MERIPSTEYESLLRKEAEMLLSFQQQRNTQYDALTVEELRRECAVQQTMLHLQQKKIDLLSIVDTAQNSRQHEAAYLVKESGLVAEPDSPLKHHQPTVHAEVLENIVEGYIELDQNLCYTYVNHKIEEITGLGADFWIGKRIWDIFKEEVGTVTYQAIQKASTEKVYAYSEDYYPQLGVWHESHIYPTAGGLSIFIVDATARKKAEAQLKETCEIGLLGGWETGPAENTLLLSGVSRQILALGDAVGLSFEQAIDLIRPLENTQSVIKSIKTSLEASGSFDIELKVVVLDGREKWLRCKGQMESSTDGHQKLRGVLQDISAMKAAKEQLHENEERFRAFMDNSPAAAWIIDARGRYEFVSGQYNKMFKVDGDLTGRLLTEIYPHNLAELYIADNNKVFQHKKTITAINPGLRQNGTKGHFLVYKFLLDAESSEPKLGGVAIDVTEQIVLNEQLASQQRFIKAITDNAPCLMAYWDSSLVCIFANKIAKEWLGADAGDMVGRNMKDVLGNEMFAQNYPFVQRVLQAEKVQFEMGGFNFNGTPGFVWVYYVPDIENGVVKGFYSMLTDITELKKAQQAIEFEEKDKEALINSSTDFICSLDKDLRIITANKTYRNFFESVTGVPVKKGDSVKTGSGFNEETWALWNSFFERALGGESFTIETVTRPEGADWDLWTECAFTPIVQNGEITGLACYSRNITDRKKAQDTIKNSEEKFRSLVQNISDIIALVDANACIQYVSSSVMQVMGYTEQELAGRNIFEVIHPNDHALVFAELQTALLQPGYATNFEIQLLHKNGMYVPVEIKGSNQLDNPLLKALLINCRDITERKEKEEERMQLVYELMEKNADLKQFSYITSHNLRAPLTNLMAICNLLDTALLPDDGNLELINAFKTSTAKLDETLNDLIKILIIKDGKSQDIEQVFFNKILAGVKSSISGMIEASGAVIHTDFAAAQSVAFYPAYMESILLNLLTNALKYSYPGRKPVIAIQTRDEEKFVVLTFMDNGIGMNMTRVKSKIFGLYQRFHGNIDGKGIGLYLVHSQVTALGGSITVDSKEGEGTTFVIWFKKELFKRR